MKYAKMMLLTFFLISCQIKKYYLLNKKQLIKNLTFMLEIIKFKKNLWKNNFL
jgi:hypothetical protein